MVFTFRVITPQGLASPKGRLTGNTCGKCPLPLSRVFAVTAVAGVGVLVLSLVWTVTMLSTAVGSGSHGVSGYVLRPDAVADQYRTALEQWAVQTSKKLSIGAIGLSSISRSDQEPSHDITIKQVCEALLGQGLHEVGYIKHHHSNESAVDAEYEDSVQGIEALDNLSLAVSVHEDLSRAGGVLESLLKHIKTKSSSTARSMLEAAKCATQRGDVCSSRPVQFEDMEALLVLLPVLDSRKSVHNHATRSSRRIRGLMAASLSSRRISEQVHRQVGYGFRPSPNTWWEVIDVSSQKPVFGSLYTQGTEPPLRFVEDPGFKLETSEEPEAHQAAAIATAIFSFFNRNMTVTVGWSEGAGSPEKHHEISFFMAMVGLVTCAGLGTVITVVSLMCNHSMHRQLRDLRKNKEAADNEAQAYGNMLGYVNHELRNPLNVLSACLEFVDESVHRWWEESPPRTPMHLASALYHGRSQSEKINAANGDETPSSPFSADDVTLLFQDLACMKQVTQQLSRQVNDILDFQHLKQGRLSISPSITSVPTLIARLRLEYMSLAGVPIKEECRGVDGEDFPDRILTDDLRLHQLLVNGLTNAIRHTERGEILLTARVKERHSAVPYLRAAHARLEEELDRPVAVAPRTLIIKVVDTGPGLRGHDPQHLFEPFVADPERKSIQRRPSSSSPGDVEELQSRSREEGRSSRANHPIPSTGLGLAICGLLAKRLEGTVSLHDYGGGCEFRVSVPVLEVQGDVPMTRLEETISTPRLSASPLAQGRSQRSESRDSAAVSSDSLSPNGYNDAPLRVLVVDDVPGNVRLCDRILRRLGCEVMSVTSMNLRSNVFKTLLKAGHLDDLPPDLTDLLEDEEAASSPPISAVFLDIGLGDLDGRDLWQEVLQHARLEFAPPCVAMTASTSAEDLESYRSSGFSGCLEKPFSLKTFRAMLKRLRTGRREFWSPSSANIGNLHKG